MPAPNLPNALLKFGLALAKHYVKKVIGDEAMQEIATSAADISGEEMKAKVDSILGNKEGEKQLLKAAKAADKNFIKKCKDKDFCELFTMEHGDLPSVQTAITNLPKELDDEALHETLFKMFRSELPKRVSDEQVKNGVNLYVKCLQDALLPVKDFGLRVLHSELKEIGKNVKDIKGNVDFLVEKAKANSQRVADPKNYARFLVPFPHNPDFVGREAELASLHEMLQRKESIVGIRPTVLVGLGGIGKTQLAVEYAHAHRDDYPSGVFWLNAINPLLFEFSDLAEKLEMADRDTPRDKAAHKAWDYLDSHPDVLVIFDNVLEPSELNVPFSPDLVPANLRCRTLFTTRQRDFPRTFQPFEVKVLPEMSAMRLLLRSRPEVLEENHPEWGWARIVCAYLGWLPLALELAAAYLGAYPEVSITGYLERLRTEGSLETVDESEVRAVDLPTRVEEILKTAAAGNLELKHQVAVRTTLQTQWKRLNDDDARLLFRAAGQFPEASWIPIPRLGLLTGIESEAKAGRPSLLNVVLKKLHAVSLIEELSEDRLRLHPLVQEFAASLSQKSFRMEMAERVATKYDDLLCMQADVTRYGVDMALEDLRAALSFCIEQKETETYSSISKMEHALDWQAHVLRNWNAQKQPAFFLQQIRQMRNEVFLQGLDQWQVQAETELTHLKKPYLFDRFPILANPAELRTLVKHSDEVTSVALSADGQLAISASLDNSIKVWDVATGRELRTLIGINDRVFELALSSDGRLAVSASGDNTLKVWDVATGRELRTIVMSHKDRVTGIALSADGQVAISFASYEDKDIKVWDVTTGRELQTLVGHSSYVFSVGLNADGKIAVSTSEDNTFRIWEISTGHELRVLRRQPKETFGVIALSGNGQLAVSVSNHHALKVWDVEKGCELHTLIPRHGDLRWVALSLNGKLAVTISFDGKLKVWDVEKGRELGSLEDYKVQSVALSADGQLAVLALYDSTLKVFDLSIWRALLTTRQPYPNAQDEQLSFEDFLFATTQTYPENQEGQQQVSKIEETHTSIVAKSSQNTAIGHRKEVKSISLSADGRLAVSASYDHTLKIWDVATGSVLRTLRRHTDSVIRAAISSDGRIAYSVSNDHTLKVWDVEKGVELRTIMGIGDEVFNLALSADGQMAISASFYGGLQVWDIPLGRELRTLTSDSVGTLVNGVALSADGHIAVTTSDDNILNVWDVGTGSELYSFKISSDRSDTIISLTTSANGQLVFPDLWDKTIKKWKLQTMSNLPQLQRLVYDAIGFALSADEKIAVTVSNGQTLEIWDVKSNYCVAYLFVGISLTCYAVSADGKTIVAGDSRGGVHFFELVGADELLAKNIIIEKSWLALKKESESGS